ncbi:CcdB family protein [Phenylobacterium sp.]|uniref:CcdB family protein n=1 Tax=Phenylobacterium sp. TaxID=1871053 RepID=UPI0025F5A391|nr:CcdB family protein [Phenylobacterium sp.]MBX3486194.1 CcdB family protein [Phenylobacterium sp.]
MIRQFDLIENPSARSRPQYPYLVVLQSHLLTASNLTVVAPVLHGDAPAVTLTSVAFEFQGRTYTLLAGEPTTVDAHRLSRGVGNLLAYEDDIRRALDRVFTGF